MLIEADHVLELVDERRGQVASGECLTDVALLVVRVGYQSIEDLGLIGPRVARPLRHEVGTEKVAEDDSSRVVAVGAERVYVLSQQYHDDAVPVDIRLPPEGGRVDRIEELVEKVSNVVELWSRIAPSRGGVVHEDGYPLAHR